MIQMGRARPVISPPSHTHSRFWATAWFASTVASQWGTKDQNTPRPTINSSMGGAVSMAKTTTTTPMTHTWPSPLSELIDAVSRQRRLRVTVPPDARMVGPTLLSAAAIAPWRSSCRTSSSR